MGLQRVRTFCLADAHIVCANEEQAVDEISGALDLIEYVTSVFGLKLDTDYRYRLSLGDRTNTEKYYKDDAGWEKAEGLMRALMKKRGSKFEEANDEAAFYGPKIDIQMKNANGKEDTAFTVQYDLCMPSRFDLSYVGDDGKNHRAFVVHRSSIGAIERIMAFLIEKYAGAFPLWLSPVQAKVLPVSEKHNTYANDVLAALRATNIRAEVDDANESLGKKIRNAKQEKIPYLLVVGDKEVEAKTISVDSRDAGKLEITSLSDFITKVTEEVKRRA
ncbi:MAG: His/Gly/Thr/Pro-type tRNA ligase C-terminal domain-containing protein [Patescibacteria group bacterium]